MLLQGDMPSLFRKFDSNGNGELTMDEFCVSCLHSSWTQAERLHIARESMCSTRLYHVKSMKRENRNAEKASRSRSEDMVSKMNVGIRPSEAEELFEQMRAEALTTGSS